MKKLLLVVAALAWMSPAHAAGYHVSRHLTVGGEGGWDYPFADAESRRLYLSHATRVEVLDLDSGNKIGTIEETEGVHGIAIAHDLKRGFVSDGRANAVTVFDLATLKTVATWKTTGENPDAILYDKPSRRLFTFNGRSKNTTVFDAASGTVVATIPLGGKPEFAVSRGDGVVFVNIEDTAEIAEIDAKRAVVVRRWTLAPCEAPTGLAYDPKTARLFSVCENERMIVSDAKEGKVVASVPIGAGTDGAAFDESRHLAFSANGTDGTITVVREVAPGKYEAVETVVTARGARTITLDEKTHRLYTPTAKFGAAPAATTEQPRPRRPIEPGTFEVIEVAP